MVEYTFKDCYQKLWRPLCKKSFSDAVTFGLLCNRIPGCQEKFKSGAPFLSYSQKVIFEKILKIKKLYISAGKICFMLRTKWGVGLM